MSGGSRLVAAYATLGPTPETFTYQEHFAPPAALDWEITAQRVRLAGWRRVLGAEPNWGM